MSNKITQKKTSANLFSELFSFSTKILHVLEKRGYLAQKQGRNTFFLLALPKKFVNLYLR